MAPNGATFICDKLGLLQDFPHEVGEEGEQQQHEDASNPNQEVSGQSRGVYFSLVHAEKLLSHPGKATVKSGFRGIGFLLFCQSSRTPATLVADHDQDPLRP